MGRTILIQLINPTAIGLLREMEKLQLIKVLNENVSGEPKLSYKYRGVFSKEDARNFNEHTKATRNEWSDNLL
jgi:hypothetical protein